MRQLTLLMTNKNYRRGYAKEREVVLAARKQGYIAYRSAGSHSPIDVTVIQPNKIQLLQLKRVKRKYYNFDKDIKQLESFKAPACATKELWIYRDYEKRGNKWQKIMIQ